MWGLLIYVFFISLQKHSHVQYLQDYNSQNASCGVLRMAGLPPLLHLTQSKTNGVKEHEGDRSN